MAAFSFIFLLLLTSAALFTNGQMEPRGNEACPCIDPPSTTDNITNSRIRKYFGGNSPPVDYGVNCSTHDENRYGDCKSDDPPKYCERSWCYVDRDNCNLTNRYSEYFSDRYFSYATCGYLDSFTYTHRRDSLKYETLKVGYNSNSGGWKGAYNKNGSFAINDAWSGPIVDFIQMAADSAGFYIKRMAPPEWLRNGSKDFFGASNFDFCVYATSLGYLDMCVASYTINMKRSSITNMFETESDPVYLIVHDGTVDGWETFWHNCLLLGQPFSYGSWFLIVFFTMPMMGMLMYFHEYDNPGTAFPRNEVALIESGDGGDSNDVEKDKEDNKDDKDSVEIMSRKIPMYKHLITATYMSYMSFFEGAYAQGVVSLSGKIHLMGIAFFAMIVLAVYTANLAAILTQEANLSGIDGIDSAIKKGYNFCAERMIADIVIDTYGVDPSYFVPDPEDGKPGFSCPSCKARQRVFDFLDPTHSDKSLYCNIAITKLEDLDAMHNRGYHCNKTKVGDSLHYALEGIPIFSGRADALISVFQELKGKGEMTKKLAAFTPESICPDTSGEGTALTREQLSGVWIVTFGVAIIALLVKGIVTYKRRRRAKSPGKTIRTLRRYDQWGNPPPYEVIIGGYRYDAEGHELRKVGGQGTTVTSNDESDRPYGNEEIEPLTEDHTNEHGSQSTSLRRADSLYKGFFHVTDEIKVRKD